ncbi:hypothetical protein [Acinetobacter sp. Ver3]|uniref:hypothetical protein n=1 Tax=Acinetobacter sp. Ver3 TaxID=466088 RepID=UPI00044D78A0|nr:hypothetical protein [Acinetobacter sp. Ver3]EZQ12089.1 hypothetical protein CL42_02055 [Acinetobacter sp. Ver3]
MSEPQNYDVALFESAFEVTFPVEIAQRMLAKMEGLFGSEFDRVHGKTDSNLLIELLREALEGITPQQLKSGWDRIRSERWCPTIAGIRDLCLIDDDWWSAELAWVKAMNFEADQNSEITIIAKHSLDDVRQILKVEGQKAAHRAFIEIYKDNVTNAKKSNRVQVMYVNPKKTERTKQLTNDERNRSGVPCPPELLAKVRRGMPV